MSTSLPATPSPAAPNATNAATSKERTRRIDRPRALVAACSGGGPGEHRPGLVEVAQMAADSLDLDPDLRPAGEDESNLAGIDAERQELEDPAAIPAAVPPPPAHRHRGPGGARGG